MVLDDRQQNSGEWGARIQSLEAENRRLSTQAAETGFLYSLAQTMGACQQPYETLKITLEEIAKFKNISFGAFCEVLAPQIVPICSYSLREADAFHVDCVDFSEALAEMLEGEARVCSGEECQALGLNLTWGREMKLVSGVLLIPFQARFISQGVLILGTDDLVERLSESLPLVVDLLRLIIPRLDALSLLQALQNVNLALNMEIDRRESEQRKIEDELRKTLLRHLDVENALLRQRDLTIRLAETSPVGVTILDKNGNITYANPPAGSILGLQRNQASGKKYNAPDWKITDYLGNPFPDEALPFVLVMRTKQPVTDVRHAIEKPNGERVLLSINAAPLFDDGYQFDGIVATIEDVTEHFEAHAEFRHLQDFNTSIVQNILEGIVVQDSQGDFTFVNPAAAQLLRYSPEELIGKHWTEVIAPEYHQQVQFADARRLQGLADRYEIELLTKTGQRIPVLVSGSPRIDVRNGQFLGSLAVFTDISEQKLAEKNQRFQRDLALQLASLRGIESALRLCVETALENTDMEAGGIYLIDRHTGNLSLSYTQNLSPEFLSAVAFYPADSHYALLVKQGKPIYTRSDNLAIFQNTTYLERENLKVVAILPVLFEGKVIACLNAASRKHETIAPSTKNTLEMISAQVGSAVARALAEERLKKRADQLALLNDVGEQIAAVLDLESVLNLTAQLVHASFEYQHVAVFMLDPQKEAVTMRTLAGDFKELFPAHHTIPLGTGVVGVAAQQNRTILVDDVRADRYYVNFFPDRIHTQSELSVPIQIGGEVVGIIDVQSSQPNAFDETDVLMMETLADQVAVAIHNANLHENVQRELIERKRIETALRESEEKFRNIVQASPMGMHIYQLEANGRLVFLGANPSADLILGVDNQQFIGKTIEEAFPSLAQTEVPERYRLAAASGVSWQTEQINYDENGIRGAFEVHAFQTSPGRMVSLFLDVTERKNAEIRIQQQIRQLAALSQIDAAITANISLDRTLDILLEQTTRQLEVDAAAILLNEKTSQSLRYLATWGFRTDEFQRVRFKLGEAFAGRVALERRLITTNELDHLFLTQQAFAEEGFRSYYGVPLIARGQIKGVLEIFHRQPLEPDLGWLSFLETLAGQAAIAIENAEMVANLEQSNQELRLAYKSTLEGWAKALELRDFETEGHSRRVTDLTTQMARALGIPEEDLIHIQRGALLHDIGKMAIPDQILLKPGCLDPDEWKIMQQHPVYAYEMLSNIEFLRPALDIPLYHHEKWDGTGYPYGLEGESIPLAARIFAVIDVWDALSSDRPYRSAWDEEKTLEWIRFQAGKHFDPQVVGAFLELVYPAV